ncbi:hypothetical protein MJI37_34270, partial [Salmonella enterica subsp. enterica serovar Cerro]|nr:hypothetical protein [Salmonella enterica subsp. enterica serovar Cerro]
ENSLPARRSKQKEEGCHREWRKTAEPAEYDAGSPVYARLASRLQVIVIALVAMAIALLSTLYPSWRAAATQPAEALRYE